MGNAEQLVQLRLDARRLAIFARERRMGSGDEDEGYLVHSVLRELFGQGAPSPFFTSPGRGGHLVVLGYSTRPSGELLDHARQFANPDVMACLVAESLASKAMPTTWAPGQRVGFHVRVTPVQRQSQAFPGRVQKGEEVDSFLVACWKAGHDGHGRPVPVDREAVYRRWLVEELARREGAELVEEGGRPLLRLTGFQRSRVVRRNAERQASVVERPDVTFEGELRVTDSERFRALLARGVGRHRAFGFGMLRLVPPR